MNKVTKLLVPVVASIGIMVSAGAFAQGGPGGPGGRGGPALGQPGFYGVIPPMQGWKPKLWNAAPIIAGAAIAGAVALYLNVPNNQRNNWSRYCAQYNACGRPVYFVQDNWYRNVYAPQFRANPPPPPPRGGPGGPQGGPGGRGGPNNPPPPPPGGPQGGPR